METRKLFLGHAVGTIELHLMTQKSSRRDFLKGKAAVDAVAELAQRAVPEGGPSHFSGDGGGDAYVIRVSRRAMACEFEVILNAGQHAAGTEASLDALDLVDALEAQLSVFCPTSEISRINRVGADGPVEVEPRLFELLELALRLHSETDGAFDITSAPLWKLWGFARRAGNLPTHQELGQTLESVGSRFVELDRQQMTVCLRAPGVELNLGSIGKGHALDRCAELLAAAGIDDFLLHGGQSSVLARGSKKTASSAASDGKPSGWVVAVCHPVRRKERLAEIRLRDRGLGTSGSGTQYFVHEGRRYGHVLDPRTGRPAEGVLSATVVAPTAAEADALSTAVYVMGPESALEYCRKTRPDIGVLLVCPTDRGAGSEVISSGFEDDELTILQP